MANVSRMKSALVCDNVEAYLNYLTAIMMNGTVAVVSLKAEGNENAAAVLQSFTTWPLALRKEVKASLVPPHSAW